MNSIFIWTLSDVIEGVLFVFFLVLVFLAIALNAFTSWQSNKKRAVIAADREKNK